MPLRADAGLWWNLPGVVAAWQPVRAPGPLLARYNMAHGGDNRYRATDGTAPTWSPITGWTFDNTKSQYLTTGVVPDNNQTWSVVCRAALASGTNTWPLGASWAYGKAIGLAIGAFRQYYNGGVLQIDVAGTTGVFALAGNRGFYNGVAETGTIATATGTNAQPIYLGGLNNVGAYYNVGGCRIQVCLIANRILSAAEAWTVSRQMAYCDVNPEWSVWARRRQWFYGPQVGGFQAAWARGSNVVLRGGP